MDAGTVVEAHVCPVLSQFTADGGADEVTVLLQLVQGLLDGLVDGLFNRLTHFINLVYTPTRLLWVGDVNRGHVKATLVEAWASTQLLDYLHHHSLSVGLPPGLVRLAEVEADLVRALLAQVLHDVEGAFAQRQTR